MEQISHTPKTSICQKDYPQFPIYFSYMYHVVGARKVIKLWGALHLLSVWALIINITKIIGSSYMRCFAPLCSVPNYLDFIVRLICWYDDMIFLRRKQPTYWNVRSFFTASKLSHLLSERVHNVMFYFMKV